MALERKRDDCQKVLNQATEDLRKQKKELESLPVSNHAQFTRWGISMNRRLFFPIDSES